jgi:hypothetical protein
LGILLLAGLGAGCAFAQPVVRLTPQAKNVVWAGGTAITSRQGRYARVALGFLRQDDDRLVFRVEIENTGAVPLLVDPSRFYFTTCSAPQHQKPLACKAAQWAINPEQVLLNLDLRRSREVAEASNQEGLATAFMFLDLSVGVAGAASGHGRAASNSLALAGEDAAIAEAASHRRQYSSFEGQRAKWEVEAFRKSTILPGDRVGGTVYLGRDINAGEVRLHIRTADEVLVFPFDQVLYAAR